MRGYAIANMPVRTEIDEMLSVSHLLCHFRLEVILRNSLKLQRIYRSVLTWKVSILCRNILKQLPILK